MPTPRTVLTLLALTLLAPPAAAAPIARTADLTLSIGFPFIRDTSGPYGGNPSFLHATATGATVQVDPVAKSISIAAGAVALTSFVSTPVTGNTSVANLVASNFANAAGTFFVGGAAGQPGEPPCPVTQTGACVEQNGFGGAMGVVGTLGIQVIPNIITLPVDLSAVQLGLGGSGTDAIISPFTFHAAPWTIGVGSVQAAGTPLATTTAGSVTASGLRLVAPTYIGLAGVMYGFLDIDFTDGQGVPSFVLEVVPEPEGFVLVGLGALLLGLLLMPDRGDD